MEWEMPKRPMREDKTIHHEGHQGSRRKHHKEILRV